MSDGANPPQPKDKWDKLDAASGILGVLASIIVAAVGGCFTYVYQRVEMKHQETQLQQSKIDAAGRQRVAELEATERMIQHLTKAEDRELALTVMGTLASPDVMIDIARVVGGPEAIRALEVLAVRAPSPETQQAAQQALTALKATAAIDADKQAAGEAARRAQSIVRQHVITSPSLPSGAGKSFSEWYQLCGEGDPGEVIVADSFQLVGDRSCGAWSECKKTEQSESKVCWQFRMQGHDEDIFGSGVRVSQGVLTLSLRKKA